MKAKRQSLPDLVPTLTWDVFLASVKHGIVNLSEYGFQPGAVTALQEGYLRQIFDQLGGGTKLRPSGVGAAAAADPAAPAPAAEAAAPPETDSDAAAFRILAAAALDIAGAARLSQSAKQEQPLRRQSTKQPAPQLGGAPVAPSMFTGAERLIAFTITAGLLVGAVLLMGH